MRWPANTEMQGEGNGYIRINIPKQVLTKQTLIFVYLLIEILTAFQRLYSAMRKILTGINSNTVKTP